MKNYQDYITWFLSNRYGSLGMRKIRETSAAPAPVLFGTEVGSSSHCVQGESCREAAGALISSIADACDVAQQRAQDCSLDSLQPQQKAFGATSDRWSDPLCELACVLRSRCTECDEEPEVSYLYSRTA